MLTPNDFGLIAMIGIFISIGDALIKGGLTNSLIRSIDLDETDYSTVFYLNLIGSLVVYLILYFLAPFIANFYHQNELVSIIRLFSTIFIINAFSAVQITRLTKLMDFKTQLIVSIPSIFFSSLLGIYMAYTGYGVWSLVWSAIAQSALSTIQLWFYSNWRPSLVFSSAKFKVHFKYGMRIMLSSLLDIIFVNIYTLIIGRYFLTMQVGYYNRANTLLMFPVNNLSMIVSRVSFPLFASIQNDDVRLKEVYKKNDANGSLYYCPNVGYNGSSSRTHVSVLFTEKWLPAVPYFQILCYNGILYPIHSYNLQILNIKGRSDLFLRLEVIKKLIVIVMVLISFQFGIFGLLVGSTVTSTLAFFINTYYSGKFINYKALEQFKDLFPILLISVFTGFIIYTLDTSISANYLNDFFRIILQSSFGIILFVILSMLFKVSSFNELKIIIFKR